MFVNFGICLDGLRDVLEVLFKVVIDVLEDL